MIDLKTIQVVLFILFVHWIADFVLRTDKQAKGKSKNWDDLLDHTLNYSAVWYGTGMLFQIFTNGKAFEVWAVSEFTLITFIFHTITDYFTSRLNSKLYDKGQIHNFFVSIGFDQLLHYTQLLFTYWYLTK